MQAVREDPLTERERQRTEGTLSGESAGAVTPSRLLCEGTFAAPLRERMIP